MTKQITIIGDNYISKNIYNNLKRYGKLIPNIIHDITFLRNSVEYIIDTTFNDKLHELSINYASKNKNVKMIILNHWQKQNIDADNISQLIVYDVYSENHYTFERCGYGNDFEGKISYCNFISETLRRVHEYKLSFIPIIYLAYGENNIRYSNVENLYKPILKLLDEKKKVVCYYDNTKSVADIISIIKEVTDYNGEVVHLNNHEYHTNNMERLYIDYNDRFHNNIKRMYEYLKVNNQRFFI